MESRNIVLRNCIILTAATCLIWDGLLNLGDEYKYIWRGPWTAVKAIYIFSRWFGITVQIINCILVLSPILSRPSLQPETCRQWFGFQTISGSCLLASLVVVLALRVYALYNQDRMIGLLLTTTLLGTFVTSAILGVRTINSLRFDAHCNASKSPKETAYFSAMVIVVHSLMWLLTVHKRNVGSRNGIRIPIIRMILRDGAWVFIALCSMLTAMVLYSFGVTVAAHVIFPWPITMTSMLTCHLILNMRQFTVDDPDFYPQLTSCIDVSPSRVE